MQNDRKYIPDFLLNDRTLFVAAGSVEAYVDFAKIDKGAITESADHRTVEIKLPAPQLDKPSLDKDKSYVYAEQRGLLNRLGDVFSTTRTGCSRSTSWPRRIADAARDSGLQQRAEENTRKMLEGLLRSLGYKCDRHLRRPVTRAYGCPPEAGSGRHRGIRRAGQSVRRRSSLGMSTQSTR